MDNNVYAGAVSGNDSGVDAVNLLNLGLNEVSQVSALCDSLTGNIVGENFHTIRNSRPHSANDHSQTAHRQDDGEDGSRDGAKSGRTNSGEGTHHRLGPGTVHHSVNRKPNHQSPQCEQNQSQQDARDTSRGTTN